MQYYIFDPAIRPGPAGRPKIYGKPTELRIKALRSEDSKDFTIFCVDSYGNNCGYVTFKNQIACEAYGRVGHLYKYAEYANARKGLR